jgi:hypothetical protein
MVAMRDSKDPHGPVLRYPASSWRAFVDTAKGGGYFSSVPASAAVAVPPAGALM